MSLVTKQTKHKFCYEIQQTTRSTINSTPLYTEYKGVPNTPSTQLYSSTPLGKKSENHEKATKFCTSTERSLSRKFSATNMLKTFINIKILLCLIIIKLTLFTSSNVESIHHSVEQTKVSKLPKTTKVKMTITCPTNAPFLELLFKRYQHQPTFLQAVKEMAGSLDPLFNDPKEGDFYKRAFAAMTEPERAFSFRVSWEDDNGVLQFNRAWRIEFSSVLGPYKGGLRLHPSVDDGLLKFLGFEQVRKFHIDLLLFF
jgi:Glu/Leu/Phe/Val dehydrogenase, dimerisation domain